MPVEFKDNTLQVKEKLGSVTLAWLEEASGELQSQIVRNTVGGHSGLRDKWQHMVDKDKGEAVVGHPWQLAIWYEFGTGEYAQNGDGRKGYWVYVRNEYNGQEVAYPSSGGKQYTREEAKRVVARMRAEGLDAHYTSGMHPRRPMQNAFESLKNPLIARLESMLKGEF